MCALYGWTPDYVLDRLTLPEVLAYRRHGREAERARATVWINVLAEALGGGDESSDRSSSTEGEDGVMLTYDNLDQVFGPPAILEDGSRKWGR